MIITILGVVGIALLLLYDLATLQQLQGRATLAFLGYGLHGGAILAATLASDKLAFSGGVWLGWFLVAAGFSWLVYCLFLFTPIANTYVDWKKPILTTSGPYAFSRHPGVLGHAATIAGLILLSRSALLVKGGIVWIIANYGYVCLQDQWLFPRLFPNYGQYKLNTPMVFPTWSSLKRFRDTGLMATEERRALN